MTERVDAGRLRDLTLELVEVESPTGDTAEVARLYAQRLEQIGMEVELLDDVFPKTPTVVGRLRGAYADVEYVAIPELVRATSVYVTMLRRLLT
jgi:acetylornithine deacetylase/succinyl-diaminopimelate desuccinylase-like protein